MLTWSTAAENKNDFFTIEKTANGKSFELIGHIDGAGSSDDIKEYSIIDSNPFSGTSYYRLKQTDFDGKFEYFPLIAIHHKSLNDEFKLEKVWPNPFKDKFSIQYVSLNNEEIELQILNSRGNQVYSKTYRNVPGDNVIEFNEGAQLKNDTYIIYIIQNGANIKTIKVIKQS